VPLYTRRERGVECVDARVQTELAFHPTVVNVWLNYPETGTFVFFAYQPFSAAVRFLSRACSRYLIHPLRKIVDRIIEEPI
jgi:hypothetical protein